MSSNDTTKLVNANLLGRGDLDHINTKAYRFEAVVDWIAFRIETVDRTQWPQIQKHLVDLIGSKPYVRAIDPDTGKKKAEKGAEGITSTLFDLRVYDDIANSSQKLGDLFAHLATKFPLVGVPVVTGIEIAFDTYSRGQQDDELRELTQWMMERLNAPNENVRQYNPKLRTKKKNVMISQEPAKLALDPELNLRMGNQGADLSFQVYWKRTDKPDDHDGGRRGKEIDHDQWRVRTEFTLTGAGLATEGMRTLDDLAAFDLWRLAKYIRFRGLKTLDQIVAENVSKPREIIEANYDPRAVCLTGGRGRGLMYASGKIRKSAPRMASSHTLRTKATDAMNDRVTRSFKALNSNFHTIFRTENEQSTTVAPSEPA